MLINLMFVTFWICFCLLVMVGADSCLIISEINADNPGLDTTEFVELYHTSGQRASLDGYTLVFYNGKGNVAYKVLDLKDHSTDDRGFFLVGSLDLVPKPAILLPPNTVQNGPDAVVLYRTAAAARYLEKMNVTAVGLVDAVVYMTRRSGGAEFLAEVLTPGEPAFVEDEAAHEADESIERCLLSDDQWGFRVSLPSPGQRNNCTPPAAPLTSPFINELKLGSGQVDGSVELTDVSAAGPVVLVVWDGKTDKVSVSMDPEQICKKKIFIKVTAALTKVGGASGAVAIYSGRAADFPVGSPLRQTQPLDAFVFAGPGNKPSSNLTETLIPGRLPYQLSTSLREGGFYLSRCGVATWARDPGTFWEAPQTPGLPNKCPWPKICPHTILIPGGTDSPPHLPPGSSGDFLINELNTDTPGAAEDGEYIELWHPSGLRASLQGVWILLFSAHNNKPYREISLSGHFTTSKGYFLLGSDRLAPAPSLRLPPNTIQNGPDAVALYRSLSGPPSAAQRGIPTRGLLDAVVYRQRGSDMEAQELSQALTPGQLPLLEDPDVLPGDEALSRCGGLYPLDLSAFSVAPPTPLRENVCPRPPPAPEGVVISEVSSARWSNHSQQGGFVELQGPALTDLRGLVLSVFDQDAGGTAVAVPLRGVIDQDGFYVVGHGHDAGLSIIVNKWFIRLKLATIDRLMALRPRRSKWPELHLSVGNGPVSLSRCSCCQVRSPSSWTSSSPTPHSNNVCPSSAYSSQIDLCLGPPASSWQEQPGGSRRLHADFTEALRRAEMRSMN
uniref:Si:ch211-183d21.1 n=1 Tax=Poecilia reticulata TaxID=8081 RepID=A0A3P9PZE1_POERE